MRSYSMLFVVFETANANHKLVLSVSFLSLASFSLTFMVERASRNVTECRGLTRATYILCVEHPRPMRLSRESNPEPPALQANALCKEPFEWRY
jgi:hypothetical protein